LGEINRAINSSIRYVGDLVQHGMPDRWSSPLATFAAGRGDCEDYAIAKYVALREAGLAESDLRLLLVRDRAVREDHLVLAARHDGRWLILDNRRLMLLEANELPQYAPLFAFGQAGVMLFVMPALARASGGNKQAAPAPAEATTAVSSGGNGAPLLL
jgi:predicted transglutaminase-like cysteine proteinase